MPAPSNTQQRREEIAFALGRVMARTGYDGATVAAIAAEAGVATGGVHYHFEAKADILMELVERLTTTAANRIVSRLRDDQTPRERIAAVLDGLLAVDDDADPSAVALWALVGAEAVRNREVARSYGQWLGAARGHLLDAFRKACRAERRRPDGAREAAAALVALVEGYYAVAAGAPGTVPPGSAAPTARRIAYALLDSQPRGRA